ncbi:MAG: hypothetical protein KGL39_15670 [Patescibacteria group bacterium]|nr:hypothetical protein [Patescibacteria group bacterium]
MVNLNLNYSNFMQIANGTVILSPENQQVKYGITPAEALILYKLHRVYANGTPLGDLTIQPGEAVTIEAEGKPAEEAYFNQHTGRHVEAKPAVPAKTHKRTQAEEIARLKRKYTGNITEDGVSRTAFIATFGSSIGVRLPETFAEIEEVTGHVFHEAGHQAAEPTEAATRRLELMGKMRADLAILAVDDYRLKVHKDDSKEAIVNGILAAEEKARAKAEVSQTAPSEA